MTIWFTSDQHFSHANILTFTRADRRNCTDELQCDETCKAQHPRLKVRPEFSDVTEMDEYMIAKWNSVVKPADHVWHLGDVTMLRGGAAERVAPILDRLNGQKRLILGNHDYQSVQWYSRWFKKIRASEVKDNMLFTHYPVHPFSLGRFDANVHGHIHNNSTYPKPYFNVSVEVLKYTPISLEQIRQIVNGWA